MSNNIISKVTESTAKFTGKRWCAHHHGEAAVDAGSYVQNKKYKRWICNSCQEKCQQRKAEIKLTQRATQ